MLRFTIGLDAKACTVQVYHKTLKNEVFRGKWPPEKFQNSVPKVYEHTDSRFTFKCHRNHLQRSGWNDALFRWQKSSQNVFFRCHFAAVWRRAPKVCRGACYVTLHLPKKLHLNQFQFTEVIPEKVSSYKYSNMPSAYKYPVQVKYLIVAKHGSFILQKCYVQQIIVLYTLCYTIYRNYFWHST